MRLPFEQLFAGRPVILAPMEDVSDEIYRRLCRERGAELCVTEFVNVEGLLRGCKKARRKITLASDDRPTAIQIYGSDPGRLAEAADVAAQAEPAFPVIGAPVRPMSADKLIHAAMLSKYLSNVPSPGGALPAFGHSIQSHGSNLGDGLLEPLPETEFVCLN